MKSLRKNIFFFCCIVGTVLVAEQSFVIKKEKKKRVPSMNTLKERYAQNAGELIKVVPKVEKHLVKLHKSVINDLYDLLNNVSDGDVASLSKEQLSARSNKVVQLTHQLEKFDELLKDVNSLLKVK